MIVQNACVALGEVCRSGPGTTTLVCSPLESSGGSTGSKIRETHPPPSRIAPHRNGPPSPKTPGQRTTPIRRSRCVTDDLIHPQRMSGFITTWVRDSDPRRRSKLIYIDFPYVISWHRRANRSEPLHLTGAPARTLQLFEARLVELECEGVF